MKKPLAGLSERDAKKKLIERTIAKLDEEQAIVDRFIHAGDYDPGPKVISDEQALEAAKNGDITLLRKAYPEFVEYLHLPARKPGRPPKSKDGDAVREAVLDVQLIRRIWKEHPDEFKRLKNVTAEQIAADRWGVDIEAVCNRLKKFKRSRSP
jgi:hypothetical protein